MNASLLLIGLLLLLFSKPSTQQAIRAWINEIHYNRFVADNGFFLEVAHKGGHIYGYSILFYKIDPLLDPPGSTRNYFQRRIVTVSTDWDPENPNRIYYKVLPLSALPQIPDGFALVDNNFNVLDFVSFDQVYGAGYPVNNKVAFRIGIQETSSTPASFSLQLCPDVFRKWTGPLKNTQGTTNTNCISNAPSRSPSKMPTSNPTEEPSLSPTDAPTNSPTEEPSKSPSTSPSTHPSAEPSKSPSANPSKSPSAEPSKSPSAEPSKSPSAEPSKHPTDAPSKSPSKSPSHNPTARPLHKQTDAPSKYPTEAPSKDPSSAPTKAPACTIAWNLYNSKSNALIVPLTNGTVIASPPPCGKINIEAVIPCGTSGNQVWFELWQGAKRIKHRNDKRAPYFLFGNNGKDILDGSIGAGRYGIRAIVNGRKSPFTNFTLGGKCVNQKDDEDD